MYPMFKASSYGPGGMPAPNLPLMDMDLVPTQPAGHSAADDTGLSAPSGLSGSVSNAKSQASEAPMEIAGDENKQPEPARSGHS